LGFIGGLIDLRSHTYVQTIISSLPKSSLHLSTAVRAVQNTPFGTVFLTSEEFDHVIIASHVDASLSILRAGGGVTDSEERILGGVCVE
jgi:predicted NAD/FAD-binding protein